MSRSGARLLSLLSLLQTSPDTSSADLSRQLGVTPRTIRSDVQHLRDLGYPISGTSGVSGGYRLGAGIRLPPLLLDDDEAVAMAIGLRTAAAGQVRGIEEPALRALGKLDTVLPAALRHRLASVAGAISTVAPAGPVVDPEALTAAAAAIRNREILRFSYRRHDGSTCRRDVEPHRLIHADQRWYLVAWDVSRKGWRSYRVDRMAIKIPNGPRFGARNPPDGGFETFLAEGLSVHTWPVVGRFLLHAPLDQLRDKAHLTGGVLSAVDEHSCLLTVGADNEAFLFVVVGIYDVDFTVLEPPSARHRAATLARRYRDAADGVPAD